MVKMASAILWTHSAHFCHLGCSVGFPWNLQNILFSHWQWTMWAEYAMTGCASQSAHKNTVLKREGDEKRENTKKGGECIRGLEHDNRITTTNMPDHINTLCLIILRDAACPWNYFNMSSKTIINTTHTHTHNCCCWILLLCQENKAPNNSKMKLQNRNRSLCKTIICISSIFKNWTWSCASSWQHSCLTFGLWLDLWRVHIDLIITPMTQGTIFALRWAKLRESWKAAVLSYKLYSL